VGATDFAGKTICGCVLGIGAIKGVCMSGYLFAWWGEGGDVVLAARVRGLNVAR